MVLLLSGCDSEPVGQENKNSEVKALESMDAPLPPSERKRILVLHSYHQEYAWLKDVNRGILSGLEEERYVPDKNVTIEYFYMDTKKKTTEAWKREIARKAMDKIETWHPHVVIATDDNAQKYVVAKMKNSGVNFVFLGVNANPLDYNYINNWDTPGGTITGSIERARFAQTIKLLQRLVPGARRIAIVSDDGATGASVVNRILAQSRSMDIDIVSSRRIGQFSHWKGYVRSIQDQADALLVVVYHTLKDDTGNPVHENEVLNWTINNSNLPDIGFWSWAVEGGLLASEAISGYQQGHYAATVASYVLMGQKPGEFPIDKPQRGELCINLARAEMLGIKVPVDLKRTATVYTSIGSDNRERNQ